MNRKPNDWWLPSAEDPDDVGLTEKLSENCQGLSQFCGAFGAKCDFPRLSSSPQQFSDGR
jgi:hypothetical protein